MTPTINAILGVAFVLLSALGGYLIGRARGEGVKTPPNADFPKRKKRVQVIRDEQTQQAIDAVLEAADKYDVDPDVVSDGLEWLDADL